MSLEFPSSPIENTQETSADRAEKYYQEKILPIIEILKPDDAHFEEYEEQVMDDLLDGVKKQEVGNGILIQDPEKTLEQAYTLLLQRVHAVLEDARDYNRKIPVDPELVKKSKIVLLALGDLTDVQKYTSNTSIDNESISFFRDYLIQGQIRTQKLTESDIEGLMKTKYKKNLIIGDEMYYNPKSEYGVIESIPESLLIGITQKRKNAFYEIEHGLESAFKGKYSDNALEHLIACGYSKAAFLHSEAFVGNPLEKILTSGNVDDREVVKTLISMNLPQEEFNHYTQLLIKYNPVYGIKEAGGLYYNQNQEVIKLPYTDILQTCREIELDSNNNLTEKQKIHTVKKMIEDGYCSFALSGHETKNYFKKYLEENYEHFAESVEKYNQEHLVLTYLQEEDKKRFTQKLIAQNKEYMIVQHYNSFSEHTLSYKVFQNIKEKGFVADLKGNLSRFTGLHEKEALDFIAQNETRIFLDNINSFAVSQEFLLREDVQNACFDEFTKALSDIVYPHNARIISEKIPFPKEKQNKAILNRIDEILFIAKRNDWARGIIFQFPEIKEFLSEPKYIEEACNELDYQLGNGYAEYVADILECFPIPQEKLGSEKVQQGVLSALNRNIPKLNPEDIYGPETINSTEKYFRSINIIGHFISLPPYLQDQERLIHRVHSLSNDNNLKCIANFVIGNILQSQNPEEVFNRYDNLVKEIESCTRITSYIPLIKKYVYTFENNPDEEEKKKFIEFVEDITRTISINVVSEHWDYIYPYSKTLSQYSNEQKSLIIESITSNLRIPFFKNISKQKFFDYITSLPPDEQHELFLLVSNRGYTFSKENWAKNILLYINNAEEMHSFLQDDELKTTITNLFEGNYKDEVLKNLQEEWVRFLSSGEKVLPPNLYAIANYIDQAGGAGTLKHVESLGNLLFRYHEMNLNSKTVEKTKKEIKTILYEQETIFQKKLWSQDDKSEFYNLSKDILEAAPSLFSSFDALFKRLSAKDLKIFIREVFPFYQAQLVIMQKIKNDSIFYNPRDLVMMRSEIESFAKNIEENKNDVVPLFEQEKTRLINFVKEGFKNRFGLLKIPETFSKEDFRTIQNSIRYIGNINSRDTEKETLLSFYLGLELNKEWESFRQGKEIVLGEYFSNTQIQILEPILEKKKEGYKELSTKVNIGIEKMPQFQEILQDEVLTNMIGNIQTIDIKLGNIKRNIEELTDADIYNTKQDKELIQLLASEEKMGKLVGQVLAKTFTEVSGKPVTFTEKEKIIQSKIATIFDVQTWNTKQIKEIQDSIQPLALVTNMINKMEEEKVEENIQELQKRLIPKQEIIDIFNRLGEEFKQESGALALSKDLAYLENLIVKDEKKLTDEEKKLVKEYIESIKEKMKELESVLEKIREYFTKIKKSSHLKNQLILENRLQDIEKIMYSTDSNAMIVSRMTKDLNLIIENMRQCLGCMRKEINNDTNLAFGDYNKFFIMNQSEKEKGSISDQIVFFVPVKNEKGQEQVSFVLDQVYGSKSSDILISNTLSVYKKYQALKKSFPESKISITVSKEAMTSAGLDAEILEKRLREKISENIKMTFSENLVAAVPKSSLSDNYIEFGSGNARTSGDRAFSGLVIE